MPRPQETPAAPRDEAGHTEPTGVVSAGHPRDHAGRGRHWLSWSVSGVVVVVLSLLTIVRYAAGQLQADGLMQAVMSVQDVDLFFWGQDRFFSFVPLLVSPIADPDANLFACLLVNAMAFHGLLLVLSYLVAPLVMGSRTGWAVAALFGVVAAIAHFVLSPFFVGLAALETQPYSVSYLLLLLSYLAVRRGGTPGWVAAAILLGPVVGLNPAGIMVAGAIALATAIRARRWARWWLYGFLWLAWEGIWVVLQRSFGGREAPDAPVTNDSYFSFSAGQLAQQWQPALAAQGLAVNLWPLAVTAVAAAVLLATLPSRRRARMLASGAWVAIGCVLYWGLFAANEWVKLNGFLPRYFYPIFIALALGVAAPIAAAVAHQRSLGRWRLQAMCAGALVPALLLLSGGPWRLPADATALADTRAVAQFSARTDVTFVAGSYWAAVPVVFALLRDGRSAAYYTGFKSGGSPESYRAALTREQAEPDGPPRAVCVNASVDSCLRYLEAWTEPGWTVTAEPCPVPGESHLVGPEQRSCAVLEYER